MKLWRKRSPIFGPLGAWELLRVARRGHAHRARLLVLYLLALAFVVTVIFRFGADDLVGLFTKSNLMFSLGFMTEFANQFAAGLLFAIFIAVVAMTPAFSAFAIAEEKERQTLQLLLTTPLADREIVLGKTIGRLGFQLAAVVAGIPVLCTTMLFGNVSPWFLIYGYAIIVSTTLLTTAIGVKSSCERPNLRGALILAYSLTFVFVGLPALLFALSLVSGPSDGDLPIILLTICVPFQLIGTVVLLRDAVRHLRRPEERPMGMTVEKVLQTTEGVPPNRVVEYEKLTELLRSRRIRIENDNLYLEPREITLPALPPIDDSDPVGWKERYVVGRTIKADSSTSAGTAALGIIAIFLIGLGIVIVSDRIIKGSDDKHRQESGFGEHFMIAGATIAAGLYLVPAGIGIAAAIARERQRRTLDDLLSIPWDRRQILDAKFEAIIRRNWGLMPMAGIATGLAFWASTTPWIGLAAVELVYGGTWMVIGLGALLTVRCANAILAFRFVMPAIVIGFGAPLGLSNINEIMGERWMRDAVPGIAAALAATGTLCWRKACRDFDRLG